MSNIQTGAERMPHDLSHLGFLAGQIGGISRVDLQACKLGVIMVIAVSCVKLLSAHNSTQHTSRKHKV